MRAKSSKPTSSGERVVKDIRRATRRHFSAEDKIRIVLEGLRGADAISRRLRARARNEKIRPTTAVTSWALST